MTVFRIPVRSRLSTIIDRPGGMSVGVAIARAEANQASLRDEAATMIEASIADLLALRAPEVGQATDVLLTAYRLCNAIIDAAGPFGMNDLCQAAAGLCDLIDANGGETFDWRLVESHAQAMRLLVALAPDDHEARATIGEHLSAVVARKLGPAEA